MHSTQQDSEMALQLHSVRLEEPPRGTVVQLRSPGEAPLDYFLYLPRSRYAGSRIFVSVHGISGNAREHAEGFASFAEEHGIILLAPRFSEESFHDYQRLGRKNRGHRADVALRSLIKRTAAMTDTSDQRLLLFGFSGGGQFVHRYAMAYPEQVAAYVSGSAGWYTFPDATIPYPRGILGTQDLDLSFDPARFLRVPGAVIVGERDIHQGYSLNKSPRIVQQQGVHRLERGRRWVEAMNTLAQDHGIDTKFDFLTMPRCNHGFARSMERGQMAKLVFDWFLTKEPLAS